MDPPHAYGFTQCLKTRPKARVTGFDRVNPILFINQNDIILIKNKKISQRVATEFLTESCRVNRVTGSTRLVGRVFNYPYFFINLAQFQSRVDPPSQARF